jgi:hypothetical protein
MADFNVFGSPIYVLDKAIQDRSIRPGKWKDRSHQGVYVGHSPYHASNVILVYNPKTQLVSPSITLSTTNPLILVFGYKCPMPVQKPSWTPCWTISLKLPLGATQIAIPTAIYQPLPITTVL